MNGFKYRALRTKGYDGPIDDMFMQHIQVVTGSRTAIERDYWLTILPTATGGANDVKMQALGSLGYTGAIYDREREYWRNVTL